MEYASLVTGSARIHYTDTGQGEALLLVHGLSGSARWWRRNLEGLSRYFRVLAVDLPGFGRSRGQPFRLENAPAQLSALLDALGLAQAHLMGHSMGGLIAVSLAACRPERVSKLVLVDAAAAPLRSSLGAALVRLVRSAGSIGPSFYSTLVRDAVTAGPVNLLSASRALLADRLAPDLPHIRQPTLVIWGTGDSLLPPSYGRQLLQLLPQAEWRALPRAGHNPMWDQPNQFNELVIEFLTRRKP